VTERTARVAAPVAVALFALIGLLMARDSDRATAVVALTAGVVGVVLAVRRQTGWPMLAGLAVVASAYVVLGHQQSANLAWMGLCVVAGWVALTSATRVTLAAGAAIAAIPVVEWALQPYEAGWGAWFVGIAFTTVSCLFARRLRLTVAELRRTQAELATRTRAQERSRIAAEVHDVIGHALTVSLLHVSSARLALDDEPEQARRSLEEAERLARASLEEVRATVGVLRADDAHPSAPMPDAGDIPELVESFRVAGADVRLDVVGDPGRLGAGRGLAAYRIVQEALTNSTRHSPDRPVTVTVEVSGHEALVRVRTVVDGATLAPPRPGAGLLGMQERAQGVGGRVAAGPDDAGWLVEAVLPA
jgi:signal transduction histidine kinase